MGSKGVWRDLFKSLKVNDWSSAIRGVDRLIESEPDNYSYHLKKGDIYQKSGNIAEAVNSYRKAAWHLNNEGFLKKALAIYKLILRLDPENQEATDASTRILMELMESGAVQYREPEVSQAEGIEPKTAEICPEAAAPLEVFEERASQKPAIFRFPFPLTEDEMDEILRCAELKRFSDREKVIIEGDTGDSIYIIKSGYASVVMHMFGREIDLAVLSDGDFFGEVAFLTGRTRTATIVAKGDLEVYEINRILIEELIEKKPEVMSYMHEVYMERVKDTFKKVKS